ncbi:hypothetical protein NHX12_020999 [Muraenolepis orangiensis]|uniref:Uncharacterized protein n=1 Tax=Muraenolepis orangiensis TaxID=630683 RepID=A0A9Q0ESP8_9TELE|nr:hypothetical protein NHX12_020999 [Muraenolepis orangiensis]
MGDSKAVLSGCEDRWTLQDRGAMPRLFRMTVCVHVRVLSPGAWIAFSYNSAHAPRPELGLEGDGGALYGWLLGVRHRFPAPLAPRRWQQVCLRRDVRRNTFSLHVDGMPVAERTVIAHAIPPSGSLWLGCRPRDHAPGTVDGRVELYLFRVWPDLDDHAGCEDGSVIGWDSELWGVTSSRARQRDGSLGCAEGFSTDLCPVPSGRVPTPWGEEQRETAELHQRLMMVVNRPPKKKKNFLCGIHFASSPGLPASASSPVVTMATTHTQDESQATPSPVEGTGVTSSSTNQQLPIDPTANTSEAPNASTTASANGTTDYTSQPGPLNPPVTTATSTNVTPSTTVSTGSLATGDGVVTTPTLSPVSRSPPSTDASAANQITGYTQAPSITAQPAFQILPPIPVPMGSSQVNCDITPFCSNDGKAYTQASCPIRDSDLGT